MMFVYKIADVVFGVDICHKYTYNLMKDYLVKNGEKPQFTIKITQEDIQLEKRLTPYVLPEYTYESTAIYRKFIYVLLKSYDAFFLHCSAISMDNEGYMFTAKSGTGKSTHRSLWVKNFGDRVTVINDDKPIIRNIDGVYYIYGTPWQGKEGLGSNIRVPAKALCFLSRSETNSVNPMDTKTAVSKMLNQVVRPDSLELMSNLLKLLDGFLNQVKTFHLCVNMEDDAPIVAYNGIK